jgi:hypothetical protein
MIDAEIDRQAGVGPVSPVYLAKEVFEAMMEVAL